MVSDVAEPVAVSTAYNELLDVAYNVFPPADMPMIVPIGRPVDPIAVAAPVAGLIE